MIRGPCEFFPDGPDDPEPDRDGNYYKWLQWWYRQPQNQEKSREIERIYIEAMQKDKNLD
jgi:hypothetical protein